MGKIYYMMGKSSSGKDTLYGMLMKDEKLRLKTVVPYTTRPMRAGEENGVSYYFCDEDTVESLKQRGKLSNCVRIIRSTASGSTLRWQTIRLI